MSDEVVVVREHGPCFEFPPKFACDGEKPALQNVQTLRCSEMVSFTVSAGRDEVGSVSGESMRRRVSPRHDGLGHAH